MAVAVVDGWVLRHLGPVACLEWGLVWPETVVVVLRLGWDVLLVELVLLDVRVRVLGLVELLGGVPYALVGLRILV